MSNNMLLVFLIGIVAVGIMLIVVIALTRRSPKGLDREKYQTDWLAIENRLATDQASQQMAIIDADKLLDRALKERGFRGQTMGERMTSAGRIFSKREAMWAAHKLRNKIAHEEVKLNIKLTRQALGFFKQALKDIGAL